jgi:hypothetical protein
MSKTTEYLLSRVGVALSAQKHNTNTGEYHTIKNFYGDKTTVRSNVPLINHIDEGLLILDMLNAGDLPKRAFCLHPIVQNDEDVDLSYFKDSYMLAVEYRDKANSYLCRPENDHIKTTEQLKEIIGDMSEDCRLMLIADKMQNEKDFELYHKGTHPRSKELEAYFTLWLDYLT